MIVVGRLLIVVVCLAQSTGPRVHEFQWLQHRDLRSSSALVLVWLQCTGAGTCGLQWFGHSFSAVVVHGLINCPTGMWNFPRSGIKPISPALAGGFLTTGPPGTSSGSLTYHFFTCTLFCLCRTYFSGLYIKSVILKS